MASSTGSSAPAPVFVITGPSGAGKGTLIKGLLARLPDRLELAVSATTRERRAGEVDGVHYWFISDEEFDRRLAAGEFLEHVRFRWGQRSGTLLSEIERIAAKGKACVLELELDGSIVVRDTVPGSVTVFVDAPLEELERRLRERATESAGEIDERLGLAREQKRRAHEFHYVVENDDVARATSRLVAIVEGELRRRSAPVGSMSRP